MTPFSKSQGLKDVAWDPEASMVSAYRLGCIYIAFLTVNVKNPDASLIL